MVGLFKCLFLHGMSCDGKYAFLKLEEWFLRAGRQESKESKYVSGTKKKIDSAAIRQPDVPYLQLRNQLRNVDRSFVVILLFFVIRTKNQKIASLPGTDDLLEVGDPLIARHIGSTPWNERFAMFLGLQH